MAFEDFMDDLWGEKSQYCKMRLFEVIFKHCAKAGPAGWSLAILALVFDLSEFLVRRSSAIV